MYLEYNAETGRITRRAWMDEAPTWMDSPREGHETASEAGFSQGSRAELITEANAIHEPGEDYDPETETSVGYLTYDADTGQIEPAAEIRELPTDAE